MVEHPRFLCIPVAQRNRPEKYNRETVKKTLKAIGKITDIRSKRQERHYERRMVKAKAQEKKAEKVQLEKEIHLIKAPAKLISEEKEKLRVRAKSTQAEKMQE